METKYLTYKEGPSSTAAVLNLPHDAIALIWHFSIIIVITFVICSQVALSLFWVTAVIIKVDLFP